MPFPTIVCVHTHVCVPAANASTNLFMSVVYQYVFVWAKKQKSNYVCAEVRVGDKWFLCVMGDFSLI